MSFMSIVANAAGISIALKLNVLPVSKGPTSDEEV